MPRHALVGLLKPQSMLRLEDAQSKESTPTATRTRPVRAQARVSGSAAAHTDGSMSAVTARSSDGADMMSDGTVAADQSRLHQSEPETARKPTSKSKVRA